MAIEDGERKGLAIGSNKKKAVVSIVPLDGEKLVPSWMIPLLRASFFSSCSVHGGGSKNECNLYCLDCTGDTLCSRCLPCHRNHRVVQIRRSSYQNVIKASEASEFIDITGVQTYVINSAKVVFLNERPPARAGKEVAHACKSCCRPLIDSHLFCSIGCKLRAMRQELGESIALSVEETERPEVLRRPESGEMPNSGKRSAMTMVSGGDGGGESWDGRSAAGNSGDSASPAERPVTSCRRSRRKGIPRRASFGNMFFV